MKSVLHSLEDIVNKENWNFCYNYGCMWQGQFHQQTIKNNNSL